MSKFPAIALLARPIRHQVSATGALERALKRAGYRTRVDFAYSAPEKVVICWSWGTAMSVRQKNPDAIILTMDHGYTRDRKNFINTGWSTPDMYMGLNGFGEHAWVADGGDRARALKLTDEVQPVRAPSGRRRALLLGQVYGDAMVQTQVRDYPSWLRERSQALVEAGWTVTFRPHPVMVRRGMATAYGNLGGLTGHADLAQDLVLADRAVALSSNGLVEAYLAGVEAEVWNSGSMLSPLLTEYGNVVPWEGREEWVHRLAWTQWTLEELEDGTWLKHHAPIMHRLVAGGRAVPWHDRRIE